MTEHNPYEAPRESSVPGPMAAGNEPPPQSAFEAVNRRFFRLLGDSGGPLIFLWGILAVLNLPGQLLNVTAQQMILTDFNSAMGLYLIVYPLLILVAALYSTSFRAMKAAEDRAGDLTLMKAIDMSLTRVLSTAATLMLYGVLVGLGSLLCLLPGVYAAFMFCAAPFICAVYGYGPVDALKASRDWVRGHGTLIVLLIGVGFVYGLIVGGVSVLLNVFVFNVNLGDPTAINQLGYIPTTMIWLLTSAVGYFMWLYTGAIFITIGRAEEQFMRRYDLFERD